MTLAALLVTLAALSSGAEGQQITPGSQGDRQPLRAWFVDGALLFDVATSEFDERHLAG